METKVVNIYRESYDVYIGRAGKGQDGYFGNPFILRTEAHRDMVLNNFRAYFLSRIERDEEFKARVLELRGKKLGCFCAPKACHGHIIAEYLDRKEI